MNNKHFMRNQFTKINFNQKQYKTLDYRREFNSQNRNEFNKTFNKYYERNNKFKITIKNSENKQALKKKRIKSYKQKQQYSTQRLSKSKNCKCQKNQLEKEQQLKFQENQKQINRKLLSKDEVNIMTLIINSQKTVVKLRSRKQLTALQKLRLKKLQMQKPQTSRTLKNRQNFQKTNKIKSHTITKKDVEEKQNSQLKIQNLKNKKEEYKKNKHFRKKFYQKSKHEDQNNQSKQKFQKSRSPIVKSYRKISIKKKIKENHKRSSSQTLLNRKYQNNLDMGRFKSKSKSIQKGQWFSKLLTKKYEELKYKPGSLTREIIAQRIKDFEYQWREAQEIKARNREHFIKYYRNFILVQLGEKHKFVGCCKLEESKVVKAGKRELTYKIRKFFFFLRQNSLHLLSQSGYTYNQAEVNIYYEDKTPLYHTIKNKNLKFIKFLLRHKANIHKICDRETGNYPIHIAFQTNKVEDRFLIIYLLELGSDLNALNNKFQTPLAFASLNVLKVLNLSEGVAIRQFVDKEKYQKEIQNGCIFDNNKLYKKKDQLKGYITKYKHKLYYKFMNMSHNPQQVCEIKMDKDHKYKEMDNAKNKEVQQYSQKPFATIKKSIQISRGKLWHESQRQKLTEKLDLNA